MTAHVLRKGVLLRLPSGNVVRLVARERTDWHCVFVSGTRRGDVVFSGAFLRKTCTVC